jgi:hypothetical protein
MVVAAKKKACLAGHEGCEKCTMHCCSITPERAAEIAAQARSGTNWADAVNAGPACRCGKRRTPWIAEGGGFDDGTCPRHPWKAPA